MPTPRGILLVLAFTMAALGACSGDDGPTVEEAGTQLAADGNTLVDTGSIRNVQVTQSADENIPCGDGKAKRIFRATADIDMGAEVETTLNNATRATSGHLGQRGYDFPDDPDGPPSISEHEFTMVREDLEITFHVEVRATQPGYLFEAETACLPAK